MFLTEEEAKKNYCCRFPAVPHDHNGDHWPYQCSTSECMAWRWDTPKFREDGNTLSPIRYGYCGLAGKPDYA
jgi:hypothetical protein